MNDYWTIIDHDNDNEKTAENRQDAEQKAETAREFGSENVEIIPPDGDAETDGGGAEVVDVPAENTADVPQSPSVADDPIDWVPSHFVDDIQGVPAINRKGYAVLAEQYDIQVTREFVTYPSETDFEYAEAEATAVTEDGREYSGFGSAHVDRQDGDDEHLLGELAETRAIKRALALATGVGMTAVEELKNEL
jgi:hypothetical protein